MLVNLGVSYNRRLRLNRVVNWQYSAEIIPLALESDPLTGFVVSQTSPTTETVAGTLPVAQLTCSPPPFSYSYTGNNLTYSGTETFSCSGRQWTIGEAMSPLGLQWNFAPSHRMQPLIDLHGGYMYSTRPIPIATAGSFNFTFDIGAGVEFYQTKARSVRAEFRYHHISNAGTATENPGIDSGMIQVTYCFRLGRQ
jgi:hypothetical protein